MNVSVSPTPEISDDDLAKKKKKENSRCKTVVKYISFIL
jgi:hypothetical protein